MGDSFGQKPGDTLDYRVGLQEAAEGINGVCTVLDIEKIAGSSTWMIYDLES